MAASARSRVLWGMHGSMRMRSGQTTAWQPYTCTGVCSKRTTTWQLLTRSQIETKLIVSLCFWSDYQHLSQAYGCFWSMYFNPSLSGMMSRRRTAAGPPPLPTDDTSVPHALLALHLELKYFVYPHWIWGHSPLFTPRELRLELSIVRVGGVFPFGSRWGLAPCGIPVWGACPHYSGHAPQRVVAYCLISGPKLMVY